MVSVTKQFTVPEFVGHNFCVLTDGSTELTYNKGRWFAHFPVEVEESVDFTKTQKSLRSTQVSEHSSPGLTVTNSRNLGMGTLLELRSSVRILIR
jgi:hypothetical protein